MKTSSSRVGRWIKLGLVTAVVASVAAGGFWWSCLRQSESYDLSQLSRTPGFLPLKEIPREALDELVAQENIDPAEKLAATQFGLGADDFRTRIVRGMVAAQIAQKFSQREIAAFFVNDVSPGVDAMRRMAIRETEPAATEVAYVANVPAPVASVTVPAEMSPLPPEPAPVQVRRAAPVVEEVPVRRALPVAVEPDHSVAALLGDDAPVRRALPVSNPIVRRAQPVSAFGISLRPVYRVAVVDQ